MEHYDSLISHHRKSFDLVSQALNIDENFKSVENKRKALNLYRDGIRELRKGIAISASSVPPDKLEKAESVRNKMVKSLELATSRLHDLEIVTGDAIPASARPSSRPAAMSGVIKNPIPRSKSNSKPKTHPAVNGRKISKTEDSVFDSGGSAEGGSPLLNRITRKLSQQQNPDKLSSFPARTKSLNSGPSLRPPWRPASRNESPVRMKTQKPTESSKPAPSTLSQDKLRSIKGIDDKYCHTILDQIVDSDTSVTFSDVIGHESAKRALREAVILPTVNPEIFTGLREPVRGILLFGPPGNGKTLLAKAVASESKCTFFNMSASSLTSKWVGEAEKLVKAMFVMARKLAPSIIFIDEIDSILTERSEKENETSRRLKTEFLLQFDGVGTSSACDGSNDGRVLTMGATNRPFDLDEAILRRFPKRIHLGLPNGRTRCDILAKLLQKQGNPLRSMDIQRVSDMTEGYSASDLTQLAKEAAMGPVRDISMNTLKQVKVNQLRPISYRDFQDATVRIRASSNAANNQRLMEFAQQFGEVY